MPRQKPTANKLKPGTLDLPSLRRMVGPTQVELSKALRWEQSEVSRFERREDHAVSSLRRYVEALGGTLEITARVGNRRFPLVGV